MREHWLTKNFRKRSETLQSVQKRSEILTKIGSRNKIQ